MKIIGLCGGSGSGKSTISASLQSLGAKIIDADQIAREIMLPGSPVLEKLRQSFGDGIFSAEGTLLRSELASIVFSDSAQLEKLNQIVHPEITKEIKKRLKNEAALTVIDGAVLHQAGIHQLCDKTIFITAPRELRLQRIIKRDGLSKEQAEARLDAQPSDQEYETITDVTVCNDGTKSIREITETILQGVM